MTEQITIDCVGKKCPRPVIEIAKAARKLSGGSVIAIKADDLAFESDVRAWVQNANATIISFEKSGSEQTVLIRLPN